MKKLLAGMCLAMTLAGCDAKSPEVGQSAEAAYGTATAQGSVAGGSPGTDIQSLQNNRANDAQVIQEAQKALGQRP